MILGGSFKPDINPFLDTEIAADYEKWYQKEGLRADNEEKEILHWLINEFSDVTSIIEVGCGTGHFSRWFKSLGFLVSRMSNNRIKSFYRTTLWPLMNKMISLPWGGFIGMGVKWLSKSENDE